MSSDILSRPVDVSKYGLIYGGAQKNIGPAGVTFVIVREDILGKVSRKLPSMVDYRNHIANQSMFNTPPVFAIYVVRETLRWLKSIGGVPAIQKLNEEKAALLYEEIDRNPLFEQEMIYYIEKLDITEEKVRLQNHCNYFREVARSEEGVGRKLGFIAQELGREINTLGSKANEATMQKMVVEMKDELEKIKEQLLNIL